MVLTTREAPPRGEPVPPTPPRRSRRRAVVLAGWLAAGWLAPVATHPLGLDWLLLIVAVVGTAGLFRSGRGALDRLVLALALLYCAVCVGGLLFSVWPWRLHPVPVAGFGFTVIIVSYAATGRRFSLPWRPRVTDLGVLAGTALAATVALWPMLHRDPGARMALFMHVEDFLRHMLMYDGIRSGGGYMFQTGDASINVVGGIGYYTYPTGSHFVMALTENFLRSTTGGGPPQAWAGDFVWLHAASFVGMCLATLWGLTHLGAGAARRWAVAPLTALGAAFLAFGPTVHIFDHGYPQELPALALVAVLVAVVCRPLPRTGEQVVLVGALLAGISFTYYLFLPVAAVLALAWLVAFRRRVLARWRLALVVAVCSAAGAAVIPGLNWKYANPSEVLLQHGQVAPVGRISLAVLVLAAAGGLLAFAVRGLPAGVIGLVGLGAMVAMVLGVQRYQQAHAGADYFMFKLEHQLLVIGTVLVGAAVALLPAGVVIRGRIVAAATLAALSLAPMAAFAGSAKGFTSPGWAYLQGRTSERPSAGQYAFAAYAKYPRPDGTTTVLLVDSPWPTYLATVYLGILQHNYPVQYQFAYTMRPWTGQHPLAQVEATISASQAPFRVITDNPATLAQLSAFAATLPPGRLTVLPASVLR